MGRDDHIHAEAVALWREMFREPPPPEVAGTALLDLIVQRTFTDNYQQLSSPYLRASNIHMPGGAQA